MYLPSHFEETRADVLHELVRAHPLGMLITLAPSGLQANAIPFILDTDPAGPATLRAHVARANPVWREARTDVQTLVVFQGAQAYISPGLYPTKAATGKVVPTWNYVLVQARGTLQVRDDPEWVRNFVTRLTKRHEATRAMPWAVSDAPADFVDTMLRAIVGIEIPLTSLTGKWKVSQNRNTADRGGVAQGLQMQADHTGDAQAAAMAALVGLSPPAPT